VVQVLEVKLTSFIFLPLRAFLAAGLPSVVVSLWKVSDDYTFELMIRFYHKLLKEKKFKGVALREAMLECKEFAPAPKHWAAFTLVGSFL